MIPYRSRYTFGSVQPAWGGKERQKEIKEGREQKKSILRSRSLRASAGVREAAGDTEAANINQSPIFYDDMF